ncbi:preprotein translocase subunit SecE [Candidatus Peregrinibacteria bacterium CG10_big_fil_rev_8_21_14_0_10_55_24]|nr:MAG: preprotein translocase subunit SecE [Candidatus Peregrinibacteria bacterium CG10_big_fil_rev_8_21_14_0_10_55_24]
MPQISTYITEAIEELHRVRWPTRQQAVRLSLIVIVFCAVTSLAFGVVDFGLSEVVRLLLTFSL